MIREQMEAYLDGGLEGQERAMVEGRIAGDGEAGRVLAAARADRAARAAVFASYVPPARESAALAAKVLAACDHEAAKPVGRVGQWVRRGLAVAAGVGLLAGTFAAGRLTAPRAAGPALVAQSEVIRVLYADEGGEPQMKEFGSLDDANVFCREMAAKHAEPVVVASGFDEEHPGSF